MQSDTYAEWDTGRATLRRGWWFVALSALAVMAVAAVASYQLPVDQRATGRLIVAPSTSADVAFSPDTVRVLTQPGVIGTLAEIVENPGSLESAAGEVGVAAAELADYSVAAQEVAGSMVVEVHVDGPDAAVARSLADELIEASTQQFDELYPVYRVHMLDPVRPVEEPTAPSVIQYGVIGGVVGAAGAILLLLVWDRLRRRFASQDRAVSATPPPPPPPRAGIDVGDDAATSPMRTIERS